MHNEHANSPRLGIATHSVRRKRANRIGRRIVATIPLERRLLMANFIVGNTNNAGDGSLRQAMLNANAAAGLDTISFSIDSGVRTISPTSELPELTSPVFINGTTQPGFEGRPIIQINGENAGEGANGFRLREGSGGSTIRGLVINRFGSDGIDISQGNNNIIVGNYIGTNVNGTEDLGNQGSGVDVGTDGNRIGGFEPGDRNVISGNSGSGVVLAEGPDDSVNNNRIIGNFIGTNLNGNEPIPNNANGVAIERGINNAIGGGDAGAGNVIAFNGGDGVSVFIGSNNHILRNSIFGNSGLGIDLAPNGVTQNDNAIGDPDDGPNGLQNFPVLTGATRVGSNIVITGSLNSTPNHPFRVEFFASAVPDPTEFGEGRRFLGAVHFTTEENGSRSFTATVAVADIGEFISATATSSEGQGSTSEFSHVRAVTADGDVIPPTVIAKAFLFETLPLKVSFKFSEPINPSQLGPEDVVLRRIGTEVTFLPTGVTYDPATQTATFTLAGILDDGVYTARLRADAVRDLAGNQMAADNVLEFFFLAGDANRDRVVNFGDMLVIAQHYGQTGQTFSQGNVDYSENGLVNFGDLLIVAQNYNAMVLQSFNSAIRFQTDHQRNLWDDVEKMS